MAVRSSAPKEVPLILPRPGWSHGAKEAGPVPDPSAARQLEFLARWLDSVFEIPGLRVRFGLDAILGLIPGLGDTATSLLSLYILKAASQYGVSRVTMTRMALNVAADYVVGAIPFVGDVFDVYWKSNQRNVALLRRHLEDNQGRETVSKTGDRLFVGALTCGLLVLFVGSVTVAWFVLTRLGQFVFGNG